MNRKNGILPRIKELEENSRKIEKELDELRKQANEKPHSPRNGEIVNDQVYCRVYDFGRDSWKGLIDKLNSPKWNNGERKNCLSTIEKKLNDRIRKGCCTQKEVDEYTKSILKKRNSCNNVVYENPQPTVVNNIKAKKVVIKINFN